MEVTSEIYGETDFNSVTTASGSEKNLFNISLTRDNFWKILFIDVISKFRFNLPANREEIVQQLEHDDDSDVVVRRKKNECIEIGECEFINEKMRKLFNHCFIIKTWHLLILFCQNNN